MEELEGRLTALETGLTETSRILVHHQSGIVETSTRHAELIGQLNDEFGRLRATVGNLEKDLSDHRRAMEALSTGGAGPAGLRLVDTRIIDKPKKFHGKSG